MALDNNWDGIPTFDDVYKEIYELDQAFEILEKERYNVINLNLENQRYSNLLHQRLKMFQNGYPIDSGRMRCLEAANIISSDDYLLNATHYKVRESLKRAELSKYNIVQGLLSPQTTETVESLGILEDNVMRYGKTSESALITQSTIKRKDWALEDGEFMNYSDEFYNFITATNKSYSKQPYFHKFELYKQQAYNWLHESKPIPQSRQERLDYIALERQKSLVNSLYGISKYHSISAMDKENRGNKFKSSFRAYPAQEYMSYLFDLYLSLIIGKPRQIGATTFMGALAAQRTMLSKKFLFKFTAENLTKAQQIFFEKVRPFIDQHPFRPSLLSDQDGSKMIFGKRGEGKGNLSGSLSQIYIEAPYDTIIASGSPDLVIIDEIGNVDNLSAMMEDGRPTMFSYNPILERLEVTRQFIGLGTGGDIKNPFKDEWKVLKEAWNDKQYDKIIIPVFLDAYSKPGFTQSLYAKEKLYYYGKNKEESKIKFHQTFPLDEADMFLSSGETIIPKEDILYHLRRLKFTNEVHGKRIIPKYGYFEPVYNEGVKYGEDSDVPYQIIGANFIITTPEDPRVTSVMYKEPEAGWENRYFQGSDPIFATTGHSKCASAILDSHDPENRIACIVNFRTGSKEDVRYNFLQPLLMGLYYDKKMRNLVEINAGAGMVGYYQGKGFGFQLVRKAKIPKMFQSGGNDIGIRKDSNNAKFMAGKLLEFIELYGDVINCGEFWEQLKTYVKFEYRNSNSNTMSTYSAYKVENPRYDYDDVIDAVLYAHICFSSYEYLTAKKEGTGENEKRGKMIQIRDKYGSLKLVDRASREYKHFVEDRNKILLQ